MLHPDSYTSQLVGNFLAYNPRTPLHDVGRRYTDLLFQNRHEEILKEQGARLAAVRADYAKRNMIMSGPYVAATETYSLNKSVSLVKHEPIASSRHTKNQVYRSMMLRCMRPKKR
jgi:hypothetical protein